MGLGAAPAEQRQRPRHVRGRGDQQERLRADHLARWSRPPPRCPSPTCAAPRRPSTPHTSATAPSRSACFGSPGLRRRCPRTAAACCRAAGGAGGCPRSPGPGGSAQLAAGRHPGVGDVPAPTAPRSSAGSPRPAWAIACSRWSGYSGGLRFSSGASISSDSAGLLNSNSSPNPTVVRIFPSRSPPGEPQQHQPGRQQQHADGGGNQEPGDELLQEEHGAPPSS